MMTFSLWRSTITAMKLALLALVIIGCNDIPADNPFDPQSPPSVQAKSEIRALISFPPGKTWSAIQSKNGVLRLRRLDDLEVVDSIAISEDNTDALNPSEEEVVDLEVNEDDGSAEEPDERSPEAETQIIRVVNFRNVNGGTYILEPDIDGYMVNSQPLILVQIGEKAETLVSLLKAPIPAGQGLFGVVQLEGRSEHLGITIQGDGIQESTDSNGQFFIPLSEGLSKIVIRYAGYNSIAFDVTIEAGEGKSLADLNDVIIENGILNDDTLTLEGIKGGFKGVVRMRCTPDASNSDACGADGIIFDTNLLDNIVVCARPESEDTALVNHCQQVEEQESETMGVAPVLATLELIETDGVASGKRFVINKALSPGRYHIIYEANGYGTQTSIGTVEPERNISVNEVYLEEVAINAEEGVTIEGLVRTDGNPGAAVHVTVEGSTTDAFTNPNGEFELILPSQPEGYTLSFNKTNYLEVTKETGAVQTGSTFRFENPIDLIGLPATARGRVRLVKNDNEATADLGDTNPYSFNLANLESLVVCARLDQGDANVPSNCLVDAENEQGIIFADQSVIEEDGRPRVVSFTFNELSAGRYKVIYTNTLYNTVSQIIELAANDEGLLNDVEMNRSADRPVRISGEVTLEGQDNYNNIKIRETTTTNESTESYQRLDSEVGEYQLNLPYKSDGYTLELSKEGFHTQEVIIPVLSRGESYTVDLINLAAKTTQINGSILIDPEAVLQINAEEPFEQERSLIDTAVVNLYRLSNSPEPTLINTSNMILGSSGANTDPSEPECNEGFPIKNDCSRQIGLYSFNNIPVGQYYVEVQLAAFVTVSSNFEITAQQLESNEPSENIPRVFLTQSIREAAITGRVFYPCLGDCDHSGIQVSAGGYTGLTGIDGSYRIVVNAVPVPYNVYASHPDYERKLLGEVTLEPGETRALNDQTLDAQPGMLTGVISLPAGFDSNQYNQVSVNLRPESAAEDELGAIRTPSSNGAFSFDTVAVGDYVLSIEAPGFVPRSLNIQMGPGEIKSLNIIELYATNTELLSGVIRLEGVANAEGHGDTSLLLIDTPYSAVSNADGSFLLQANPGDGRLRIAKVGYESRTIEFQDLAAGEIRDLGEISLPFEPATINGTVSLITPQDQVELASSAVLSLSRIVAGPPGGAVEGIQAFGLRNNGEYTSPGVLGGSYLLTVNKVGYVTETRQVELPLGTDIFIDEITLDLKRGSVVGTARREDLSAQGGITVRVRSLSDGALDGVIDQVILTGAPEDRFDFDRLPIGSYRVEAFVEGYRPATPEDVIVSTDTESSVNLLLTARAYSLSVPEISQSNTVAATLGGDADLTYYRYWLAGGRGNAGPWTLRPATTVNLEGLNDGAHTVYFEMATQSYVDGSAEDPSAYISPIMSATFQVDTAAPEIGQALYRLASGASEFDSGTGAVAYQIEGSSVVALVSAIDPTPASGIVNAKIEKLDAQGQPINTVTVPFTPILELSAALDAGINQFRLQLIDAAGNESQAVTLNQIYGDQVAPTGTLSRLSPVQTSVVNVTLQLNYQDADASPVSYRLYQSDQTPGVWQSLPTGSDVVALNFALTPGESGDRIVTGDIRDAAGRITALNEVTFRYDNLSASPPAVTLNGGVAWTNSPNISFTVADPSAADNEAYGSYTLAIRGEVEEAGNYAYDQIPNTLTLSGEEDGDKRLSFLWVDGAGNRSPQTQTSISIDRVKPSFASVNLSEPESRRTLSTTVDNSEETVLFLQTTDANIATLSTFDPAPSSDLVSIEVITYDQADQALATNVYDYAALLELSPNTNASYRWYRLTVIDAAGNRSTPLDTMMIKGDQAAPTGTLTLSGDTTSNSTLFNFDISVQDADQSPLAYRLYQTDQTPGAWVDIAEGVSELQVPFTVIGGTSGNRTITGQVKDASGRVSAFNEVTVRYDINASNAPEASLDNGATWTTDLVVSLAVNPPVGVDGEANIGYSLIIEGEIEAAQTGIYDYNSIPNSLTLIDGEDGLRQVSFTWIDAAGNASVQSTEMIYIDRVDPKFDALSITQPEGSQRITSENNGLTVHTVYLKSDDAVVAVIGALDPAPSSDLSSVEVLTYLEDGTVADTQTYDYSAVLELSPSAALGIRSYGLTLIDTAGNRSSTLTTDLVRGDALSPTGSLAVNGSDVSNSTLFTIDLSVDDTDNSPLYYRLYQDDQSPGSWVDIAEGVDVLSVPFTVTAGASGTRRVTGQVRDASGRTTTLNTVTLTYDITQANAPAVALDAGAIWTTDLGVSLSVDPPAANDGEAPSNYTLTIAGDVDEVGDYAYDNIPISLTLIDGDDGLRTVRFIWTDGAGNLSLETSKTISVDRVAPTFSSITVSQSENSRLITTEVDNQGVITQVSTQYLKTEDAVVAVLTANDRSPSSEIQSIEVTTYDANDVATSTNSYDYTTILELSANTPAGLSRYELTLIDTAGNRSDTLSTPYIAGDQASPTATLNVIGLDNSRSTLFTLQLDVSDNDASPMSYRLYQTDQSPSTWFDITPGETRVRIPFTVTAGETGNRTVTGQVKDAAGRIITLNQVGLRYDVTQPDPPILTLNGGNEWTNKLRIPLAVNLPTSADGEAAIQHRFYIFGQAQNAGNYAIADIPEEVILNSGSDGVRNVRFGWEDEAGNRSETSDFTALLDRQPPSIRDFVLGDGSGYSTSRAVDLQFDCSDSMSSESELLMSIRSPNENSLIDIIGVSYASPYELTLDNTPGSQAITLICRDAAGNIAVRSGNEDLNEDGELDKQFEDLDELKIYFDDIPPVQDVFIVENGVNGVSVNTPVVTVTTSFTDAHSGIDRVAVSEQIEDCATANYNETASGEFQFLLGDPDGSRRLVLCAKDIAGNTLGPIQSNLVNLDRVTPNFTAVVHDGSGWTNNDQVLITLASSDDDTSLYNVKLTGDVENNTNILWPQTDDFFITLSAGDGEKRINMSVFDDALNEAPPIQESIKLDRTIPSIFNASLPNESPYSTSRLIDLSIGCADDLANPNELNLQISLAGQPGTLYDDVYVPFVSGLDVLDGEGARELRVICTDPAGNNSLTALVDFQVDTVAPVASSFTLAGAGPEGYSNKLQLTATIDATDATSGLDRLALFEDGNVSCADASYLTAIRSDDKYGFTLTVGEGLRTVYLCLQDKAGNRSANRLSATIEVDTVAPEPGTLEIEGGDAFTNTTTVDLTVTALEAAANLTVGLNGDFVGAPIYVPLVNFPYTVTLFGRNGSKSIQAILIDTAENSSTSFSANIVLDRTAPELGTVLYDFQALTENALAIQDLTIPLNIQGVIADYMQFWEVAENAACGTIACGDAADEVFSANTSYTFSAGDGVKRLCWRFCDEAENSSLVGTGLVDLTQQFEKPRPEVTAINPDEYTTFSELNAASLPIVISGANIAASTQVQIGEYLYSCDSVTRGNAPINPESCTQNNQADCGTECNLSLPLSEGLLRYPGRYLVRLITPAPVFGGVGTSAAELFFTVKAPPPSIISAGTHGVVREQVLNSQNVVLNIFGCGIVDNASFSLSDYSGEVTAVEADPSAADCSRFTVSFDIGGLNPFVDFPYQLRVVNPSPGGGFSELPFALVPKFVECPLFEDCVYTLNNLMPNTGFNHSLGGASLTLMPPAPFTVRGASVVGGDSASITDRFRNSLSQIDLLASGGALPLIPEFNACSPYASSQLCPLNGFNNYQRLITVEEHSDSSSQVLLNNTFEKNIVASRGSGELRRYIGCPGEPANETEIIGGGPQHFALGDLDHDNDLDLVTVHSVSGEVQVRLGAFLDILKDDHDNDANTPEIPSTSACNQDLNDDGAVDDCRLYAFTPIKRGADAPGLNQVDNPRVTMGNGAYDVSLADLNQDGILDVITADVFADTISIRYGYGDGSFGARSVISTDAEGPIQVEVADMNGDGWSDLVVAFCALELENGKEVCDDSAGGVRVYLGNQLNQYVLDDTRSLTAAIFDLDVGDLNNDGALDIIASDRNNVILHTSITEDGHVSLDSPWSIHPVVSNQDAFTAVKTFYGLRDVQFTDWNGNGALDVVFSIIPKEADLLKSNYIGVLLNTGDNLSELTTNQSLGLTELFSIEQMLVASDPNHPVCTASDCKQNLVASNFTIGDFTGDGRPDMAIALFGEYKANNPDTQNNNWIAMIPGSKTGSFDYAQINTYSTVISPDFPMGNQNNKCRDYAANTPIPLLHKRGTRITDLIGADLDGDGAQDLLGLSSDAQSEFFRNSPLGALIGWRGGKFPGSEEASNLGRSYPVSWAVPTYGGAAPFQVELADLNNDGALDVVWHEEHITSEVQVTAQLNHNGQIKSGPEDTISYGQSISTGINPIKLAIGDVDGDGNKEIVVPIIDEILDGVFFPLPQNNHNGFKVYEWSANTINCDYPSGCPGTGVIVNNATLGVHLHDLKVIENLGSTTLTDRGILAGVTEVVTGRDGNQIVTYHVYLYQKNGTTFSKTEDMAVVGSHKLAVGLLNQDLYNDVVSVGEGFVNVLISAGQFTNGSYFTSNNSYQMLAGEIWGVELADLDGDGDNDLIVLSEDSDQYTISVRLNNQDDFGDPNVAPFSFSDTNVMKSLRVVDMNNDSIADLVLGNGADDMVTVLYGPYSFTSNRGENLMNYTGRLSIPMGRNVRDTAVGDINQDGALDIISANGSPAIESDIAIDALTVWESEQSMFWRESLVLRSPQTALPDETPNLNSVTFNNIPRFVEKAFLTMSVEGSEDGNTAFTVTVDTPDGQVIVLNNNVVVNQIGQFTFPLALNQKWQIGGQWQVSVSGVKILDAKIAMETAFKRPNYENTPCSTQLEGEIRLIDTRLEICHANVWGTVCDDSPTNNFIFDPQAIDVICQSFGFDQGEQIHRNLVPNGTGQIWLDNLNCNGNESSITECSSLGYGVNNCSHSEDVGIRCY